MSTDEKIVTSLKPYGHHLGDGIVQVCFTLPVACSPRAQQAALAYADRMGLKNCRVTWMEAIGSQFTYFILYGQAQHTLDWNQISEPTEPATTLAERSEEVDQTFRKILGRRVVLLACLNPADEEAIEFEALLSLQGIAGEVGLEGYSTFQVHRYRNGCDPKALIEKINSVKADALLLPESLLEKKEFRDLDRALKGAKELPGWFVQLPWRTGTQPGQLAHQVVHALEQQGLKKGSESEPADAESTDKKRGLLRWFGR